MKHASASSLLFLASAAVQVQTMTGQLVLWSTPSSGAKGRLRALSAEAPDGSAISMSMLANAAKEGDAAPGSGPGSKSSKSSKATKPVPPVPPVTAAGPSPLAPFCSVPVASCTSGRLLEGVGPSERYTYSDTVDGCKDGMSGSVSVEKITVSTLNGKDVLRAGRDVKIEAVAHPTADAPEEDEAHFYWAETVSTGMPTTWNLLESKQPVAGPAGPQTLEVRTMLPVSGIQAVRVVYGHDLHVGSCPPFDHHDKHDVDDLVFTVAEALP